MGFNSEGPMGAKLSAPLKRPIETTTPGALTPARTSTPPPQAERSRFETRTGASERNGRMGARSELPRHSSLDTDALDSALRREISRPHRDSTPGASPSRKRQRINGDRSVEPGPHRPSPIFVARAPRTDKEPQVHPLALRTRSPGELLSAPRGRISRDAITAKEADATRRASFPKE